MQPHGSCESAELHSDRRALLTPESVNNVRRGASECETRDWVLSAGEPLRSPSHSSLGAVETTAKIRSVMTNPKSSSVPALVGHLAGSVSTVITTGFSQRQYWVGSFRQSASADGVPQPQAWPLQQRAIFMSRCLALRMQRPCGPVLQARTHAGTFTADLPA